MLSVPAIAISFAIGHTVGSKLLLRKVSFCRLSMENWVPDRPQERLLPHKHSFDSSQLIRFTPRPLSTKSSCFRRRARRLLTEFLISIRRGMWIPSFIVFAPWADTMAKTCGCIDVIYHRIPQRGPLQKRERPNAASSCLRGLGVNVRLYRTKR